MGQRTFAIRTLGCKVNQYEEQVLRENLIRRGFTESGRESAGMVIINSCTVTDNADAKTRKLIRKIKKENPDTRIIVTGCYAVLKKDIEELKTMPGVHAVIPGGNKGELPYILSPHAGEEKPPEFTEEAVTRFGSHTRAFLKIQDGCDQKCSYCKVNLVRGPSRCKSVPAVLAELKRLVGSGYKEIVLTGICLGAWRGKGGEDLSWLLKEIDGLEGNFRIRLSSIEPNHIKAPLIEAVAGSGRVCRHFHIPLQSASDRILRSMNRKYTARQFRELAGQLRRRMPLAALTMDIMAAFPGESESDFDLTLNFIREIKPSRLHVFRYSDRKGTRSYAYDGKVPPGAARKRVEELTREGARLQLEFCRKFVGREVDVLAEKASGTGPPAGYTGEYVKTILEGFKGPEGEIVRVRADGIDGKTGLLTAKNANERLLRPV